MEGTYNKYLLKLAKKCTLSEEFIDIIDKFFNKLIDFGYISRRAKINLSKKLLNNLDTVIVSNNQSIDFKTGYYDANKKELYLKDISNLQSVYLRLLYVVTTKELSDGTYSTGYSKSFQSKTSFGIEHKNFGINRAVMSNLVCRLLYTLPTTLSIVPTYRTYENNFLGYKINSDNDIYFLEGKVLRQICYVLGISEEKLYSNLFSLNPTREISKIFDKIDDGDILFYLDRISRAYSNYNKLCYYNNLISDNYIEIKKTASTPEATFAIAKKREIELSLKKVMQKMFPELDDDNENPLLNLEGSLAEKISDLEELILEYLSKVQEVLANELVKQKNKFSPLGYVTKLKVFEDMLVLKNDIITKEIHDTITHSLIFANEYSCTNLIEKIKYSLALFGLSSTNNLKIFDDTKFYKLKGINESLSTSAICIRNGDFLEIANISKLDKETSDIMDNVELLKLSSIAHMLNTSTSSEILETIITNIRDYDEAYKKLDVSNLYLAKDEYHTYIIVNNIPNPVIFTVDKDALVNIVNFSEQYIILGETTSLPTVYKERKLFNFIRNLPLFQKSN
ncbi:MAG: hypothetical protein IJ809_04695 [Clostridia bacterium]|nr:hypothetical protein [Clostridia bacterium]